MSNCSPIGSGGAFTRRNTGEAVQTLIRVLLLPAFRVFANQSADRRMTGEPRACAVAPSHCEEYGSVLSAVWGNTAQQCTLAPEWQNCEVTAARRGGWGG